MPRVTEVLRNAQILAEFSNLEPAQLDYFRHNYPDFMHSRPHPNSPDDLGRWHVEWWDYRDGEQWRMTQEFLQESWKNQFKGGGYYTARLILSVFNPDHLDMLFGAVNFPKGKEPKFIQVQDMPWGTTPFQMAVLHLFEHPWRARFCEECHKRFVAVEPKNKFCGPACSDIYRTRQKREWWSKHGNAWRRKQKFKKTKKGGR